jgi:uncharacterized membrane protein YhaH (DUF805 family)
MFGFLFNPNGRVSRAQMWLPYIVPQLVLWLAATATDTLLAAGGGGSPFGVSTIVSLFYFWPNIAIPVKRFHDRGMSGWWVLWFILFGAGGGVLMGLGMPAALEHGEPTPMAIVGGLVVAAVVLVEFVILYLLPGAPGDNRYGPDPRAGSGARVSAEPTTEGSSSWADRLSGDAALRDAASATAPEPAAPAARRRAARAARVPPALGPDGRPAFGRRGL